MAALRPVEGDDVLMMSYAVLKIILSHFEVQWNDAEPATESWPLSAWCSQNLLDKDTVVLGTWDFDFGLTAVGSFTRASLRASKVRVMTTKCSMALINSRDKAKRQSESDKIGRNALQNLWDKTIKEFEQKEETLTLEPCQQFSHDTGCSADVTD